MNLQVLANEDGFGIGGNTFWLMSWIASVKSFILRRYKSKELCD